MDFVEAERVLLHVGAQALEGLPGVAWRVERQSTLVRLRLTVTEGSAGIRFKTETGSKGVEVELVSQDGRRSVNLTMLLQRLEVLVGPRTILRVHESGIDSALVDFDLSDPPQAPR